MHLYVCFFSTHTCCTPCIYTYIKPHPHTPHPHTTHTHTHKHTCIHVSDAKACTWSFGIEDHDHLGTHYPLFSLSDLPPPSPPLPPLPFLPSPSSPSLPPSFPLSQVDCERMPAHGNQSCTKAAGFSLPRKPNTEAHSGKLGPDFIPADRGSYALSKGRGGVSVDLKGVEECGVERWSGFGE